MLTNKFIFPAFIIFFGMIILSGTLVWYGTRKGPTGGNQSTASTSVGDPYHGLENPALIKNLKVAHTPVAGIVSAAGNGSITVEDTSLGSQSMTFTVNVATDIYRREGQKDATEYQKEFQAFVQATQHLEPTAGTRYIAPDTLKHTPIGLSDIKAGEAVMIVPTQDGGTIAQAVITGQPGF